MAAPNKPPQDLSPDLKQIYDRVMNTPAKGAPTPPPPTQPAAPPPNSTTPPPFTAVASPNPNAQKPPTPPTTTSEPEDQPFLTSAPPRPLQGSIGVKSFSLGKENKESKPTANATSTDKKGISKTLIIILGVIFFAAWIFFWVVFFFQPFS